MKKLLLLIFIVLAGCATPPKPIGQASLSQIKRGETTEAEARSILGTPTGTTMLDGKTATLIYQSQYLTPAKGNYWNAALAPDLATHDTQTVTIYLNNGVVENVGVSQGGLPPPESITGKSRTNALAVPGKLAN